MGLGVETQEKVSSRRTPGSIPRLYRSARMVETVPRLSFAEQRARRKTRDNSIFRAALLRIAPE
jgi:hypothetical protein